MKKACLVIWTMPMFGIHKVRDGGKTQVLKLRRRCYIKAMQQDAGRHTTAGARGLGTVWMLLAVLAVLACDALHPCFHAAPTTGAGELALTAAAASAPCGWTLDAEDCPVCAGLLHAVPMAPEAVFAPMTRPGARTAFEEGGWSRRGYVILPRGPPAWRSVV